MQKDENPKEEDKNLALGHRKRIRQRFIEHGYDIFLDYEKLELFLTLCIPRKDVKAIAKKLLRRFSTISGVINASDKDLSEIAGVGESVICNIKIVKMCIDAHLFDVLKDDAYNFESVELIAKYFNNRIAHLEHEVLEMICLDSQLKLLNTRAIRLFEGNANSIDVDMRKIIKIAFDENASSIVIAHNHPRGEAKPSKNDLNFTKTLSELCKALKIDFIEHLIIAEGKYFSFRRQGHLDKLYDSTLKSHNPSHVATTKKPLK